MYAFQETLKHWLPSTLIKKIQNPNVQMCMYLMSSTLGCDLMEWFFAGIVILWFLTRAVFVLLQDWTVSKTHILYQSNVYLIMRAVCHCYVFSKSCSNGVTSLGKQHKQQTCIVTYLYSLYSYIHMICNLKVDLQPETERIKSEETRVEESTRKWT